MKKRVVLVLAIVGGLALLIGLPYWLVQRMATRAMNDGLRQSAQALVQNPENMTVTNAPVQFGAETSRIPEVTITGTDIATTRDLKVQSFKVVITDVEVENKTRKSTHVGASTYEVVFSADDLTAYYRTQKPQEIGGLVVAPETVTVSLTPQQGIGLAGEGSPKDSATASLPFSLHGTLTPDPASDSGLFTITDLNVNGRTVEKLVDTRQAVPLASLLPAKLQGEVTDIIVGDGIITFKGQLDGAAFLQKGSAR